MEKAIGIIIGIGLVVFLAFELKGLFVQIKEYRKQKQNKKDSSEEIKTDSTENLGKDE